MKVLLVEDDSCMARSLEMLMRSLKFNVYVTDSGEEGLDLAKLYEYDLILLDLVLPDMSGHEVLRRLRNSNVNTPVLILTGSAKMEDKLRGFERGADDYLIKPFNCDELQARMRSIVRRHYGHFESKLQVGDIIVDIESRRVFIGGKIVDLTGKEYQLLELLAMRVGNTLTKEMILNHLYGDDNEPEVKIIDVFICKLRKKLNDALGYQCPIETVWGRGYRLCDSSSMGQSKVA